MVTCDVEDGLGLIDVRVGDVGVACLFAVVVKDGVLGVEVVALLVEVGGDRALGRLSVPQEEHCSAWVPERNVSVISFICLGGNSRQVEAHDLSARTWSAPRRPKRCQ